MPLKKKKEEKFIVPGWMVSFSDMIVNMMCFFILLNSMASKQECGFQGAGTGEHVASILAEGNPGVMPATRTLIPATHPQNRYESPHLKPLSGKDWVEHTLADLHEQFDLISKSNPGLTDPGVQFKIPVDIFFRLGSARLDTKCKSELELALPGLIWRQDLVEIIGSCSDDEVGTLRAALELSFSRARAVADYLIEHGMPPERLVPSGIGDSARGGGGSTRREQKRRVELRWMLRS